MGTRGKRSAASLSTVVTPITAARPAPPDDLTAEQAAIWSATVDRLPHDWFPRETLPTLGMYCRHAVSARKLSLLVENVERNGVETEEDIKTFDRLLGMRDRETKAMIAAARSLRITKSAQTRPETAYRQINGRPAGPPPWEI